MRLPLVPILVAATILIAVVYLFNATGSGDRRILDVPHITRLAEVDGVETEVALSPDGSRCAVVADGDLWLVSLTGGPPVRLTQSPEKEGFPAWSSDGRRLTFSRGVDTSVIDPTATDIKPE